VSLETFDFSTLDFGRQTIEDFCKTLTEKSGVYRMFNKESKVIYVGKAKNLKKRVSSYTIVDKLPNRLQRMVSETRRLEIVITESEIEALLLESNLIKKLQPKYNILLKDDKSFPYIFIPKNHPFPRIMKHRGAKDQDGDYFGPFASSQAADEAILSIQKIFQIRNCKDSFFSQRKRPCLQYHIKRCTAPCTNYINKNEYDGLLEQAKDFLKGKSDLVQKKMAEKMEQASLRLDFEKAALYRDRIKLITTIQSSQSINVADLEDADVLAVASVENHFCVQVFFFRHGRNLGTQSFEIAHGEKSDISENIAAFLNQFYLERIPASLVILNEKPKEFELIKQSLQEKYKQKIIFDIPKSGRRKDVINHALNNAEHFLKMKLSQTSSMKKVFDDLQQIFSIDNTIKKIEVYDNSHLFGTNAYGVLIVAGLEGFDKKSYRKFSIKNPKITNDDFAMMQEVITRRLSHKDWGFPDLFLIDGGKGQVNAVRKILLEKNIDIQVIGIAKGENRNAGDETFFFDSNKKIKLEKDSRLLYFMQNIRDEAHRFAIQTHRKKRNKNLYKSKLDDIEGVGSVRKKALLNYFGSLEVIKKTSIKDLMKVNGISEKIAKLIYNFFNNF
jgi:excinuclease ABC subunit C